MTVCVTDPAVEAMGWLEGSNAEEEMHTKEKGRGFLLCLFRLVPSPRYFANSTYCSGVPVDWQAAPLKELAPYRTTPSAAEQK